MHTTNNAQTIQFTHATDVGPKFMSISNHDLATMATNFAYKLDRDASCRIIGNERRMTAIVKLPSFAFDAGDSALVPQLYLRNDNTGRSALRVSVGLFRLICSNGLTVGVPGLSFDERIRHVWSETQRARVLELPIAAERIVEYIVGDLALQVEAAKDTPVQNAIEIVASLPIGIRAKEDAIAKLAFSGARESDDVSNAWGLYNLVNESVRVRSRNEYTALSKDEGLLGDIIALSAA